MDIAFIASIVSSVLFVIGFSMYARRVAQSKVSVSVGTFSILALTSMSQVAALAVEQRWYPMVFMVITAVINSVIVYYGIRRKNYQFSLFDKIIVAGAIAGLLAWYLTSSAAWNVYILTAVILVSYIPLVRKTF